MDLTEKLKWIRKNARCALSNMPPGPGRYVVITIYNHNSIESGRMFGEDNIDECITYIQTEKSCERKKSQLLLFP